MVLTSPKLSKAKTDYYLNRTAHKHPIFFQHFVHLANK